MTAAPVGTLAPKVEVAGQELPELVLNALIGMKISCGLRLPSRARLEFLDDGFAVSAGGTFTIGSTVIIETADGVKLFTGEVTGVELDVEHGAPNLTVIADDVAYKMTLGNRVRTFTDMTYSDIVGKIANDYGLTSNVSATTSVQKYVLQADSDFGFMTEIADRAGYDWWVDGAGKLQFHAMDAESSDPTASLSWADGGLRHFAVRASALHPKTVTVNGWDAGQKQSITSSNDPVSPIPDAELVTPFLQAGSLTGNNAVSTAHRMFATQSDGTALATSLAARALAGSVIAEGTGAINAAITVGRKVAVRDVGPASGSYPVTEVEHLYSARGFDTRFVAGDREPTSLVDTLVAPVPSSFRQDALVVGVVTNTGDSESPKGHIKVKYPTLGDQIESAWARVVSLGAGDSRGMTFLPEVNDEVIIGFESGDISRPLVLGGLYSGASPALDYGAKDGSISKRQIVSRLGHVIELGDGDQPADQHIWLTLAGGDHAVQLSKQDGLTAKVPSGEPVSISAGDTKVELDKQGNITLSGQKITIKATQDVEISGLNVKLKANVAVEASGVQAKVSGSAQAELSSGGQTSVKGSMVMIN